MEEKKMEKKLEVSYVYDPEKKTLECDVKYNGLKDGFCAMCDEYLTHETILGLLIYHCYHDA